MARMTNEERERLEQLNGAAITTPIIISDQTVEPIVNQEFDKVVSEEAFMNEMVEITLLSSGAESEEPHIILNVNNRTQPLFRDQPTMCRRMFAEVLARCKQTTYKQEQNPYDLEHPVMHEKTIFAYPFTMIDKNPKGQAWLRAVKAERA